MPLHENYEANLNEAKHFEDFVHDTLLHHKKIVSGMYRSKQYQINYGESATGVEVKLDNSFGFVAQAGFNYMLDQNWGVHAMVSIMDIETDATVYADGKQALTSTVKIDPVVAMLGVKYAF